MPFFYNHAFQPISYAIIFLVMVTKYFYVIPYLIILIIIGRSGKWNCCQNNLQNLEINKVILSVFPKK